MENLFQLCVSQVRASLTTKRSIGFLLKRFLERQGQPIWTLGSGLDTEELEAGEAPSFVVGVGTVGTEGRTVSPFCRTTTICSIWGHATRIRAGLVQLTIESRSESIIFNFTLLVLRQLTTCCSKNMVK